MNKAAVILLFSACIAFAQSSGWKLAGDVTLKLDTTTDPIRLLDGAGSLVHPFEKSECVLDSVRSENRGCLLLLVSVERTSARSSDRAFYYGHLLRIVADRKGRLNVSSVLEKSSPFMSKLHRSVSELGAVADDGKIALLKLAEADREALPYTISRKWQTWDVDTPKPLSSGLQLNNAKADEDLRPRRK